jgi:hypothetical protein
MFGKNPIFLVFCTAKPDVSKRCLTLVYLLYCVSAFKIHDIVNTVYGTGYVSAVRENDYVVLLTHWKLAQGQSPTLHLQAEAMT